MFCFSSNVCDILNLTVQENVGSWCCSRGGEFPPLGIVCQYNFNSSSVYVTAIHLDEKELNGTLPASFATLDKLQKFSAYNNPAFNPKLVRTLVKFFLVLFFFYQIPHCIRIYPHICRPSSRANRSSISTCLRAGSRVVIWTESSDSPSSTTSTCRTTY